MRPTAERSAPAGERTGSGRLRFSETTRRGNLRAVLAGNQKLVKNLDTGRCALYDPEVDPEEARGVYAEREDEAGILRVRLEAWIAEVAGSKRRALEVELSAEEIERLRAFG